MSRSRQKSYPFDQGNCICGSDERHPYHNHEFLKAEGEEPNGSRTLCVCGKTFADRFHIIMRRRTG